MKEECGTALQITLTASYAFDGSIISVIMIYFMSLMYLFVEFYGKELLRI